jgi:hypothetical protein
MLNLSHHDHSLLRDRLALAFLVLALAVRVLTPAPASTSADRSFFRRNARTPRASRYDSGSRETAE